MPTFKEKVEIDAPDQVGLVVTGPVTGVGAGAQLATAGTGGRGWEILATGQKSAQGQDKLNIRDLGNGQDVLTITRDGKVGIGTTSPATMLDVRASDENGLSVTGPDAGVGAAISLETSGAGLGPGPHSLPPAWQILATGQKASQGAHKLNIAYQTGALGNFVSTDVFTITGDNGNTTVQGSADPLFVIDHKGGSGNPAVWFEQDGAAKAFMWWDQKNSILNLGTPVTNPIVSIQNNGTTSVQGSSDPLFVIDHTGGSGNPALWFKQDGAAKAFIWWDQKNSVLNLGTPVTNPVVSIQDNGNVAFTGDVVLTGADCAEQFDIANAELVEPGTVMALGEDGVLEESQSAYDKRVAGVISGAGSYKPGIVLGQQGSQPNRKPIALVGRVYCKVDAQYGAIETGDLLTTSPTPGHAMKAQDPLRAFGAVLGKALGPLRAGKGLIPILVALQ
jgi:hypothetical protein